jgi:hypothetical protein
MEGAGTLELLAELAVGVLGFSGIVAAIGRRASGELGPLDQRRFGAMVLIAALVVVLALLPFPLHYAGLREVQLWSWSSGIAALLSIPIAAWINAYGPGGGPIQLYRNPEVSNAALSFALLAAFGSPLILLLNTVGIVFAGTFTPYLVAVLLNFLSALMNFVRLLQGTFLSGGRAA